MNRWITYFLLLLGILAGCEQIYTPEIDNVENVIVVDARLVADSPANFVKIYKSAGYNEKSNNFQEASGAQVLIESSDGNEYVLNESGAGIYPVKISLDRQFQYKLKISYEGNSYESSFEVVPPMPDLDTVFGVAETKIIAAEGVNNVNDFLDVEGVQLYTNILNPNQLPYYRFTARKVMQYTYLIDVVMGGGAIMQKVMYGWSSSYPAESFNIASTPEFSSTKGIVKQPLYFMSRKPAFTEGQSFSGWILILYQYGITQSAYDYYNDLNKQLEANGKIFDPMYIQARNNLKCTSTPKKVILGNFEIASVREHRYFVIYRSAKDGYLVKKIPYFYTIPGSGEQIDSPPDFWEYGSKRYPEQ